MELISSLSLLATAKNTYDNTQTTKNNAENIYKAINSKEAGLINTRGSMTKLLSDTIIEPIVITSNSLRGIEVVEKVISANINIFSAYFMQVFEILTNQYELDSKTAIDLLGTDNSGLGKLINYGIGQTISNEEDQFKELLDDSNISISLEADNSKSEASEQDTPVGTLVSKHFKLTSTFGNKDNKHTFVIPITVKAFVIYAGLDDIMGVIEPESKDKNFIERWHDWKAGSISTRNLVLSNDLIEKYKSNRLKDKNDLLGIIHNRVSSGNSKAFTNKAIGFEKYYAMYIISSDDKVKLDKFTKGDLYKSKNKEDFFEQSKGLMLSIVDDDYEKVTMLTKDITGHTTLSYKAISKVDKDDKTDMTEMLKAIFASKQPVF